MRKPVSGLLGESELGLFGDYYEYTMGKADFDHGNFDNITENYFIRRIPQGAYLVAAGLEQFIHYVLNIRFTDEDLGWLKKSSGGDLSDDFLHYLKKLKFRGDIHAVPEGTPVFPNEPIINVTGPSIEVQLFETYLLALVNFQSLVATKASRVAQAARGRMVIDFGARRAHGRDAAVLAARAAFIGGCHGTSLVVGGKKWGIPYYGTMAHKFVQFYPTELDAFRAYAESFPQNSLLLIDTYGSIEGARNACVVGEELKRKGFSLRGVRLDSGDLLSLSKQVREILDGRGFKEARIFVSSELDEFEIDRLLSGGAPIDAFGVGTRLVTGAVYDPATGKGGVCAVGGVYKLVEVEGPDGRMTPKLKISDEAEKTLLPSKKQVHRVMANDRYVEDVISLWDEPGPPDSRPLLVPIVKEGELVYDFPETGEIRDYCLGQLASLPEEYRQLRDATAYPVRLSEKLAALTRQLVESYSTEKIESQNEGKGVS
ncbi:MAG: nicotinate phosphoribosyltransferase [Chloroflexi bacterium]|nr:nicotinate phosphoribosyltransferase [Chloroflexota bacterium]